METCMSIQENILFRNMADRLKKEFLADCWKVGDKVESESALMKRFQVSRKTVRNALDRLASEGLIEKSQGKRCTLLRKPPNEKQMRHGLNFGIVGGELIMNSNLNDVPAVAQGIIAGLNSVDATLSLFPFLTEQYPGALPVIKSLVKKHMADGFFVFNSCDCANVCDYLRDKKIPYVYVATSYSPDTVYPTPHVRSGEWNILKNTVEELAAQKIRKMVFLSGENDFDRPGSILQKIFHDKMLKKKIEYISHDCCGFSAQQFMQEVLRHVSPDTAIMCSNEFADVFDLSRDVLKLIPHENVGELLLFKHYSPDWTKYKSHFRIIERDFFEIGKQAVEAMLNVLVQQNTENI